MQNYEDFSCSYSEVFTLTYTADESPSFQSIVNRDGNTVDSSVGGSGGGWSW